MAVYQRGKLLAALGMSAEGDYNSTTLSTVILAQSLLQLINADGVRAGLHCVEDLFRLDKLLTNLKRQPHYHPVVRVLSLTLPRR
jgi:hypothetical protein